MSAWFACAQFPLDLDLTIVDQVLTEQNIMHRFTEEQGHQLLWLLHPNDRPAVVSLLDQWRQNGLSSQNADFARQSVGLSLDALWLAFIAAPATCIVVLLGIIGYFFTSYGLNQNFHLLSAVNFFPIQVTAEGFRFESAQAALVSGQFWRLITPTFLHFGVLHIVFNALWVWVFGRKIERVLGTSAFIILFVWIATVPNITQALWYGPNVFGGLSGVVYGLLGFIAVWQWRLPDSILQIPKSVIVFMVISLALGFAGVVDLLANVSVANGAHLGGLLSGIVAGLFVTQKVLANTKNR
ncbi:rhomboid family intramembrane serine protease [Halioxenophilus aromaticivorans]|uniref:Rhomboid family intramembrane serine protease n=1 Tax=Halioxenophilus aromaticivorans TaxID=1306992 RepID=A0AAV3TX96_9ALTE